MAKRAVITFLRSGQRYVLVNQQGVIVKINFNNPNFSNFNYASNLRGQILFLDNDLPGIPLYSSNKILQQGAKILARKITDYYCQETEKQALTCLIKENYVC